jgi:chemotaxis protein CheC
MSNALLSGDQRDALQEIANIGMGQAGTRLAQLLGCFVRLSVPRIRLVDTHTLSRAVREMLGFSEPVTALRQGFRCSISGEAIALFDGYGADRLYTALYGDGEMARVAAGPRRDRAGELLTEVANLITGACLTGLFEQIGQSPTFAPPRLMGERLSLEELLQPQKLTWERALLLEVNMKMESCDFEAHLISLMTIDAVRKLSALLDEFLAVP